MSSAMTSKRGGYTATLLANGKVLMAGGAGSSTVPLVLSNAELYANSSTGSGILLNVVKLSNGSFQIYLTNTPGTGFTVLATTNLTFAVSNWTVLGPMTEAPAGHFQFTDATAAGMQRFYKISSP
jgi:hypothetical protein